MRRLLVLLPVGSVDVDCESYMGGIRMIYEKMQCDGERDDKDGGSFVSHHRVEYVLRHESVQGGEVGSTLPPSTSTGRGRGGGRGCEQPTSLLGHRDGGRGDRCLPEPFHILVVTLQVLLALPRPLGQGDRL